MAVSDVTPSDASPRTGERAHGEPSPRTHSPVEEKGPGAALLLLALPVLCCGGPAVVAALATAGVATRGVVGGMIGAVLLAVAFGLFLRRRRHRACCATAQKARRR